MNKEQLNELSEKIKLRDGLLKCVENAEAGVRVAKMAMSVEMHRAVGSRQKVEQLTRKLNNQKKPVSDKQREELKLLQELSKVEMDKEIDLCFAENDLIKAKEELEVFEQELMGDYNFVGRTGKENKDLEKVAQEFINKLSSKLVNENEMQNSDADQAALANKQKQHEMSIEISFRTFFDD